MRRSGFASLWQQADPQTPRARPCSIPHGTARHSAPASARRAYPPAPASGPAPGSVYRDPPAIAGPRWNRSPPAHLPAPSPRYPPLPAPHRHPAPPRAPASPVNCPCRSTSACQTAQPAPGQRGHCHSQGRSRRLRAPIPPAPAGPAPVAAAGRRKPRIAPGSSPPLFRAPLDPPGTGIRGEFRNRPCERAGVFPGPVICLKLSVPAPSRLRRLVSCAVWSWAPP